MLCMVPMVAAIGLPGYAREGAGLPDAITIYTQFAHPPSAQAVAYMKTELDAIMAAPDLHFDWHSLDEVNGHEVMAELVVVRFEGACQPDSLPFLDATRGPLGWTQVSNGEILPFLDVDCDRIRQLLNTTFARAVPAERLRLMGRAMARVMAHELYHFLTKTTKHSSSGVAKASYSAADLTSAYLRFEEAELDLVREGRLHAGEMQYDTR